MATDIPAASVIAAVTTVFTAWLAYRQWVRSHRGGTFSRDREAAYLAIWKALQDTELYVRKETYSPAAFGQHVTAINTVIMTQGLYFDPAHRRVVDSYLASLQDIAIILAGDDAEDAFANLKAAMESTGSFELGAVVPQYKRAFGKMESARTALVRAFREALGASFA